ncbi:MAG TPA: helix-hairpin-helix domain-containing protein, partial [Roseimicrobium sp.]|nr:helix-hairpin-helix domain-containing protein [Roseimicrobium sp.]
GLRHDPCMLDTFIAAVRFMDGGPKKPWWAFTKERKAELARREKPFGRPHDKGGRRRITK